MKKDLVITKEIVEEMIKMCEECNADSLTSMMTFENCFEGYGVVYGIKRVEDEE